MFGPILWGPGRAVPFPQAAAAGLVDPGEARAVELLRSISDPERFGAYLWTGAYPAMGNLTRHVYLVRRFYRVLELEDGEPLADWCSNLSPWEMVTYPETDRIIALKNMIEGEELAFRQVANSWDAMPAGPEDADLSTVWAAGFAPPAAQGPDGAYAIMEDEVRERIIRQCRMVGPTAMAPDPNAAIL